MKTLWIAASLLLASGGQAMESLDNQALPFARIDLLDVELDSHADPAGLFKQDATPDSGGLNRGLALAQGLLLPGVYQARQGQWVKAAVFWTVEAGVLLLANKWNKDGDDLDAEFKAYADEHWEYGRYVDARLEPGEYALEEGWMDRGFTHEELWSLNESEIQAMYDSVTDPAFDADGGRGSHILPGAYLDGFHEGDLYAWDHFALVKTQQFYEMIGKYAQFQRGWDDFGVDQSGFEFTHVGQGDWQTHYFTPNSSHYMSIRTESNDKLIAADRIMGLLFMNHAASFLDVLIQGRNRNLDFGARSVQTATRPAACLSLSWSF